MSSIRITCPLCHSELSHIDSESIGTELECPECQEKIVVKVPDKKSVSPPARLKKPTSSQRREEVDSEPDDPREGRTAPRVARNRNQKASGNLLPLIGLLSGFGGILTCCCPISGLPFGLIGIVLGLISFRRSGVSILGSLSIGLGSFAVLLTMGWFFYAITTEPIQPENPEPAIHRAPVNPAPGGPEPVRPTPTNPSRTTVVIKRVFAPRIPIFRR
jgi:DNA-directed RNA polymerase subunit RPC12/RpoP